ncbi:protein transporter SEC31 [Pyricularia oryzae 70-15]|uniref:Protein transport protein SEC31 n=1 Tax=Pyricularia oryzae (strain 70-15 / ATCC MYA-4617 / FGSC 8958) TaxID=242507 RepID=SEC31_PYRO7|nr:protein transporter SEC31 [Pyricularia oryzae 70-15]A4RD35.1 RecName: Full=Protein transport protein SEC31 [Pyricularia oryzae 70-15]EHA48242.1 protein transporter SEC31 [Pyricularia oryzae 70-15]KAI7922108.1 protein transporter SEC31 [Pyricularia oryzae]KAI7926473.1 protein transporter SEC31 [Pyricularia oryzae]
MVRLREIPRTAAFAWSPDTSAPIVVTGTRAGAVDADFSDETKLELWDLKLDDEGQGLELQPIASISADSRFFDIAWGPPNEDHPRGIIAGALENGSLDLWDAEKLLSGASDAHMSRTTKHTGAIKSLQFNPLKPQILATAGTKGELFIYDVNDISNPFRLGTAAARSDDLECVAWNRKVPHILATGGSGGFVTVWDLKTRKASLTLNNSRKAVSAIAWDPNNSTKLLTATPDDTMPVIFLWDLRNSNAPERTLQGHEQGVLSVSWCQQDSDLLISCGKDNRTIVWNPQTGERYGEFPEVTNWTFSARFNPTNPNLSATASFDGKITIQTLQNTNPSATQAAAQNSLDGEDFFTKAQTQPQGASFTLTKAPLWYQRPVGASFGFGGKVVVFKQTQTAPGQPRASEISISHFSVDSEIGSATEKFEESIKAGDLKSICQSHLENAKSEDETTAWKVMETLVAENPRKQVVEYLGLSAEEAPASPESTTEEGAEKEDAEVEPVKESFKKHKKNRLSTFFTEGGDGDDFLAGLAATKGAKTDSPFHLLREGNTGLEDSVTRAIMLGNFAKAVEICIKADRIADAFLIANCGGKELVDQVQTAYISAKKGSPSYLRLLGSVINDNLWDVVYNADIADWKETMATLCTFAKPEEFPDLCEALGDRLFETGSRQDASFCFLVGSKLEKVVGIWIDALEEAEKNEIQEAEADNTFSVHARSLQQLIEKVTVFRHVTKFQDAEASKTSDWKLASLYDKYIEYADIVAAHGQLSIAQKYLELVPASYSGAEVARKRLQLATTKSGAQPAAARAQQAPAAARLPTRQQPVGYQPPQQQPMSTPYGMPPAPQAQTPAANPYGPPAPSPYAPAGATPYQPQQTSYAPPQPAGGAGAYGPTPGVGYGQPQQNFGAPPPPRNATPSALPPSRTVDAGSWNDVPMVTKAPPPRRSTPSVAPVPSPFANQQAGMAPPPQSPYLGQRGTATPPPPPPKAGQGPPRMASPLTSPPQAGYGGAAPPRPASAASSTYAPPPPAPGQSFGMNAPPARTASPYSVAPAAPPPSNRYAPSPAMQQQQGGPGPAGSMPPPPAMSRPPPTNPYAAAPQQSPAPGGQYAPSPYGAPPQAGQPPMAPPPSSQVGPPPGGRGPLSTPTPPPPRAAAAPPAKTKYPPGDRSHIPASAQQLVEILSRDMERVAAKAPASFAPHVKDTQKRLNYLFDHLNNEELVKPDTIGQLNTLAQAIEAKDYAGAQQLQIKIQTEKTEECGQWIVGVKRLISMSKATP